MAASMWRMNGLCRSMAGLLLLCTLLFSSGVMSQDVTAAPDQTDVATTSIPAAAGADDAEASRSPAANSTQAPSDSGEAAASSDGPEGSISMDTITNIQVKTLEEVLGTIVPAVADVEELNPVVPNVTCVGKKDIPEQNHVKAEVENSTNCEATKLILQNNPAKWCSNDNCNLNIFQEGNQVFVTSDNSGPVTLAEALKSKNLKDKLGVSKVETASSPSSSVFVGILVSGILAAIGIIVGYFKCQRRPNTKGPKLPEEGCPVDQENQGNTLVSVAPLNPPPETQEKPNINGESTEPAKTQTPPPTNGHSTAKTADTEL